MIIAVDFDGTIVEHNFPDIGAPVPGAIEGLKKLETLHLLILYTIRSDGQKSGDVLTQAVNYCRENGVVFFGINENPDQKSWSSSPKVYAQVYIDDAACGCPLVYPEDGRRAYVDWVKVMETFEF